MTKSGINAVDLFCGVGGLTHGLKMAGISVRAGVDLDPACKFPFEKNNAATFINRDVSDLSGEELSRLYPKSGRRVLVGCAPCQPFSRYSRAKRKQDQEKWGLLNHFRRLVTELRPAVVSMENVPELQREDIFRGFVGQLASTGYKVSFSNVFCPDYGVPQQRTRLVLLASLYGQIALEAPTHSTSRRSTVRHAIFSLPPLKAGQVGSKDSLHRACRLTDINLERISFSKPGGCWRDWPQHLIAPCHRRESGLTYPSVYGRMEWDKPAPTITTQFFGYGNGRFGHPTQNRAISLREGAILQSFPESYEFAPPTSFTSFAALGRLIGNAVPVRLGEIIGNAIVEHLEGIAQ